MAAAALQSKSAAGQMSLTALLFAHFFYS